MDVFFSLGKDTVNEQFCKMPCRVVAQDLFHDDRPMPMTMKKILFVPLFACAMTSAQSQVQINPQVGLTFQNMTSPPSSIAFKGAAGWMFGADLRVGDRLYVQPGAFFTRNRTVWSAGDTLTFEEDVARTNFRLKALLGYRVIDTYQFDLRFAVGPTYDVLLGVSEDDGFDLSKGDFRNGSFNIDAALGFDMGMISLEPSISFGLSRAFDSDVIVLKDLDSRYITYGLTLGINLGNDDNE